MNRSTAFRAWMVVGLLWTVALLNYLDRLMITTMRESLVESIPMSDAQFGLLTSVFLWVYGVLSPLAGYLADRFGRSRVIVASLVVWSAVTGATVLAHDFTGLLIARALMGISEACYLPAALALIADYHRGPTRSLATGIHITGLYVGSALGGVGGILATQFGWRFGFVMFGGIGVAYSILLAFTLRDPPDASPRPAVSPEPQESIGLLAGLKLLAVEPSYWILLVIFSGFSMLNWAILTWLPTYLREAFSLSQGAAGISATAYNQVGSLAGILLGGLLADLWSRSNARGRLLVAAIGGFLAGPCVIFSASTGWLAAALLGFAIYGLGKSFCDANWMPILCQVADRRYRALGYGVMNFWSCLMGGLMAYAGGALRDHNVSLTTVFQVLGVLFFLCGGLFLVIRPRQ